MILTRHCARCFFCSAFMRERILSNTVEDPVTLEEVQAVALQQKVKKRRKHRKTHGLIGFQELSKRIAARWKEIPPWERKLFEYQAMVEKHERDAELKRWKEEQSQQPQQPPVPSNASSIAAVASDGNSESFSNHPGAIENLVGSARVEATDHALDPTKVSQPVSPSSSTSTLKGSAATIVSRTPSPVSSLVAPVSVSSDSAVATISPTSSCAVVDPLSGEAQLGDTPVDATGQSESFIPGAVAHPDPVTNESPDLTDLWDDLDVLLPSSSPVDGSSTVPALEDDFPLMDYEMLESLVQ